MKKILLIVMLFASVLILNACGNDKNPMISDPDSAYMTVKEGNNTYIVKNRKVYDALKNQVGYTTIMDMIDTDLLKNTKNAQGVSYWDQITDEDIKKEFEEDMYGTEELTEEEKEEKKAEYLDMLFSEYGLNSEEDVYLYYRLTLAKKAYAHDLLVKEVEEKDFTENEYKTYFNNNYRDEYYAIVVSFSSYKLLENAMKQLGYKFANNDIAFTNDANLNNYQIAVFFIQLYNMVNAQDGELALNEGTEYSINGLDITFDLEKLEKLHYTYSKIVSYESAIQKALDTFEDYSKTATNFYTKTPQVYKSGSRYSMYMKISEKTYDLDTLKSEIKTKLIEQRLTDYYINTKMVELRLANNIELYERSFINQFRDHVESLELDYKHNKTHKFLVAKTDVKEYNADELFAKMNFSYGISSSISELEFTRFLENLDINNVYNFQTKKAIDQDRWDIIQQSIKDEKANFKANMYAENGYPASIGWKEFIKQVYNANSEDELIRYFIFQEVSNRYAKTFGDLEGLTESSPRWQFYLTQMQKMVDEYFNVTGFHLLITVNDTNSNPVNPENWTEHQVEAAKDFYKQVMDYLNTIEESDDYAKKVKTALEDIQKALNKAPYYVAGVPADQQPNIEGISYVYNNIEISRFKSAGLTALYQDLGTFSNGSMVKEFNDAAKSIWDADDDSDDTVIYASTPDDEGKYEYLVTQFGYHIYVNTKTTPIVEYADGKVIPTLADAIEYIKDNNSTKLTTKVRTALQTYVKPIHTELTSTENVQINSYKAIRGLTITLHHDDYSLDDFNRFLDLTIANKEKNIKYK
jgi:hypothetical protein